MKRVMTIYGTRPEAIKVAPMIKALDESPYFESVPVVTGQHREMLDQVNDLFEIKPVHDLDLMVHGAGLADLSSRALATIDGVLAEESPDVVVVQGDTSTAFIGGLAAFYRQIPVVHLEAGLRTHNVTNPFPEEGNRQLLGRLAALHLAPTSTSRANLQREAIDSAAIAVTGNTVIDALHDAVRVPASFSEGVVSDLVGDGDPFVLVTAHRRESWGAPMREAMEGLRDAAERQPGMRWLVPMHRNPVVREVVRDVLEDLSQVVLCEPLDYHEFCHVMGASHLVLTDSGGVQEEAPSLAKPVLVMRDTTERPEAVDAGTVRLVGTRREVVRDELLELLTDPTAFDAMANAVNPYGDGRAAARCVAALADHFDVGARLPDFDPECEG